MTFANAQPFAFDTEFDARGGVVASSARPPMRRAYSAAEVEAMMTQARDEARQQTLAEIDGVRAMALAEIGRAVSQALPALSRVAHEHRAASAELALTAARVIAGGALDLHPLGPLRAALESLGQEVDASPRLVVRAAGLDDETRAAIEAAAADAGFSGQVSFRDEPALERAAFTLEWADGQARFSPEDAARRILSALQQALAAEAGHAETLDAQTPGGNV